MKQLFLILCMVLCMLLEVKSQPDSTQDYIRLNNGTVLYRQILVVTKKYVKIKASTGFNYKLPADSIESLYSTLYGVLFESHYLSGKRGKYILGRIKAYEGEFYVYGFMRPIVGEGEIKLRPYVPDGAHTFAWIDLYFRHNSEPKHTIHKVSISALENKFYFNCPTEMNKLLKKLDPEYDFNWDFVDFTWNDLMRKYKCNCEAQMRDQERNQNQK